MFAMRSGSCAFPPHCVEKIKFLPNYKRSDRHGSTPLNTAYYNLYKKAFKRNNGHQIKDIGFASQLRGLYSLDAHLDNIKRSQSPPIETGFVLTMSNSPFATGHSFAFEPLGFSKFISLYPECTRLPMETGQNMFPRS